MTGEHETPTQRVGQEIRAHMARRNYTQSDIADVLGLTQTAVSNRLAGRVPWDVNELSKVATALNVGVTDLIGESA